MRIVVRSDYGKKGLAPITDRWSGKTHILTGQPLGGSYDLVYQENPHSHVAEVYQCPTLKKCQDNTACRMRPEFWNCQPLYQAEKKEFCRYHKVATRTHMLASWAVGELIGGFIVDQIIFLNQGIGLIAVNINEVVENYELVQDLIQTSCRANGLGEAMEKANHSGLIFAQEKRKEQVSTALTIFKASNTIYEEGSFPASLQKAGRLKPLRTVYLDPLIMNHGMLRVTDQH